MNSGNPILADDLMLISPNRHSLQHQIDTVVKYAEKWGYSLNAQKCKFVIFGEKAKHIKCTIKIGNTNLQQDQTVMHVGINLHQNMTCKTAIEARLKKGRASLFSLLSIKSNKKYINPELNGRSYPKGHFLLCCTDVNS